MKGLRTAVAMFTVLPVPRAWHAADGVRQAVAWLPLLGAGLGALAGLPTALVLNRVGAPLLAAALGMAGLALLTRGLHLDGLADTADGLGSRAAPARALEIMRRSDIGPFGVVAVVLVLIVDVGALASLGGGTWRECAALVVAAATARLAVAHACLPGIPTARSEGFGSLVAGTMPFALATAITAAVLGAGSGLAAAVDANPVGWPVAQAAALVVGAGLRIHTTRRLGGVTGDVFGALIETTTSATLVGLVLAL
jgi:adenosylcobinamide-GDP ribazoletransferase